MGRTLFWHALIALTACTSAEGGVEQALLKWVVTDGGQVHFSIERPCATCERGAVSSHAFAAGDELARIPAAASLPLHGGDSLAEAAFRLLEQLHGNASLLQRYTPFLAAMPAAGEVLALEALPDAELAELQTPALERLARARRREVQAVYSRRKQAAPWLSLPELQHMASLVRTRSFGKLLGRRRLVPALDMLNHAEQANARVADDGSKFLLLLATRPIAAGEEITLQYKSRVLHRPDASLLLYGFLPPSPDSGAPLLPAVDLPAFMAANPSKPSDTSDDRSVPTTTASWAARLVMLAQYDRLSRALAAMPTSAEQDEALLAPGAELTGGAGGSAAGAAAWQRRVLVDFRLRRKRALRAALARMEAAWSQLSSLCALSEGCAARAARLALAPAGGGSGPASPLEAVLGLLPTALLAPLGSVVLWAWRLRQIGAAALLAQPDILVPLACGAAMLFIARRGGLRMR